jgi:phage terminase small subunit
MKLRTLSKYKSLEFLCPQKNMNIRQQKYKKNRLLGMNQYNAARSAGYSETTSLKHTKVLEKRVGISDILERQGLTDEALVRKHKELLEAYSLVIIDGKVIYEEKGGVKRPEYQIQARALELAYKLKDLLRDKVEHSGEIKITKMGDVTMGGNRLLELNIG